MEPYRELLISKLPNEQLKVAVTGVIVSVQENGFLMDDGTGQVIALQEDVKVKEGSYVRVFGQLMPFVEGKEVQTFFVQNLEGIDKEVHRKVLNDLNGS